MSSRRSSSCWDRSHGRRFVFPLVFQSEASGKRTSTSVEYDAAVAEVDRFLDAPNRSADDTERHEFLTLLIEDYDRKHHDFPGPDLTPAEVVDFML